MSEVKEKDLIDDINAPKTDNYLLSQLRPGDILYTKVEHVSQSGMTRDISVYWMKDNEPLDITYAVAQATKSKVKNGGVRIQGCGMDMGFALVYDLSYKLFPEGFLCPGEGCTSSLHNNKPYPKPIKAAFRHTDGGYALRQKWL